MASPIGYMHVALQLHKSAGTVTVRKYAWVRFISHPHKLEAITLQFEQLNDTREPYSVIEPVIRRVATLERLKFQATLPPKRHHQ